MACPFPQEEVIDSPNTTIFKGFSYAGKKERASTRIFQLKVTLLGTMSPIWRRLLAPADLTLTQLHDVMQAAMA